MLPGFLNFLPPRNPRSSILGTLTIIHTLPHDTIRWWHTSLCYDVTCLSMCCLVTPSTTCRCELLPHRILWLVILTFLGWTLSLGLTSLTSQFKAFQDASGQTFWYLPHPFISPCGSTIYPSHMSLNKGTTSLGTCCHFHVSLPCVIMWLCYIS